MAGFDLFNSLSDKAKSILQEQIPLIRTLVLEKLPAQAKGAGLAFIQDNDRLKPIFETTYQALPLPIRTLVKQDTFVNFCLSKKDLLFANSTTKPDLKAEPVKDEPVKAKLATKPKPTKDTPPELAVKIKPKKK